MFEYAVMAYREGNAQEDIQRLCEGFTGWRLKFVLPDERVVIFERTVT